MDDGARTALRAVAEDWRAAWRRLDGNQDTTRFASEFLAILARLTERGEITEMRATALFFAASRDISGQEPGALGLALALTDR